MAPYSLVATFRSNRPRNGATGQRPEGSEVGCRARRLDGLCRVILAAVVVGVLGNVVPRVDAQVVQEPGPAAVSPTRLASLMSGDFLVEGLLLKRPLRQTCRRKPLDTAQTPRSLSLSGSLWADRNPSFMFEFASLRQITQDFCVSSWGSEGCGVPICDCFTHCSTDLLVCEVDLRTGYRTCRSLGACPDCLPSGPNCPNPGE
jgi:hypothetical protein